MTEKLDLLTRSTCRTCRWFDRDAAAKDPSGLCRESSPQVSVIMQQQRNMLTGANEISPMVVANFPQVGDTCWCGKWRSKWGAEDAKLNS